MKRFSIAAFVITSEIHLSGTFLLFWIERHMLYYDHFPPPWFIRFGSIWIIVPWSLSGVVQGFWANQVLLVLWSFCVGAIAGFIWRSRLLWRREIT
jgi:hypothetical protein